MTLWMYILFSIAKHFTILIKLSEKLALKYCGQHVEESDPAPPLHSGGASPGALSADGSPQYRRNIVLLEHVQRRAAK